MVTHTHVLEYARETYLKVGSGLTSQGSMNALKGEEGWIYRFMDVMEESREL